MQGHLNSIIGPWPGQSSAWGPYLHNRSNEIELNIYILYWYFQQNQCLNIKKHAVHNIHRLAWAVHAHALKWH
jgi:hypothetical protein